MSVSVLCGDCVEVMAGFEPETFSAVVTDPPYHLTHRAVGRTRPAERRYGVYGRARGILWASRDGGDVAFRPERGRPCCHEAGRVPVAFASTRGYHRMVCAIEDAGFVIHPMLGWIFASGFPKAHDLSKAIDRAAGARREK